MLLAVVVPAAVAAVIGAMMFYGRISDVYMGVITLVVTLILFKFMSATAGDQYAIGAARLGGFNGIPGFAVLNVPGMPEVSLFGVPMYYVARRLAAGLLSDQPLDSGALVRRVLVGIRENESRCELLGYSVPALQDRHLHHQRRDGRAGGVPVRELDRDRHTRRVQPRPLRR